MSNLVIINLLSVFVIVYYIQITISQSINATEASNTANDTKTSPISSETSKQEPTFKLKSILFENEELSYEDFLSRNPQRTEISSTFYPDLYPGPGETKRNIVCESGTGVDIIIHDLDLNPTSDFLYIRSGLEENSNEKGIMYTGQPDNLPIRIRMLSTNSFFLHFVSQESNTKYRGFLLTYTSYGEIPMVTETPTTEFPIQELPLEFNIVHLQIPVDQQNNSTWEKLRILFSDMANKFVDGRNISADECKPDYVVFQSIKTCPSSWRNADSCVSVEYAIPLPILKIDEDDKDNQYKIKSTNFDYELTKPNLEKMWELYANESFFGNEIGIFEKQNSLILLMWVGISLGIITAFLVVLYCIWRMDELNAYRRFRNKRSNSDVQDNTAKPSIMEEQARYYLEPKLFDEDLNENQEHVYPNNNNLFVITDDDEYSGSKRSFSSFHQPNSRVIETNGVPKSALKNNQMIPHQYNDNIRTGNEEDEGRITINTKSTIPARPQHHIYLPNGPAFEESTS